MQLKVRCLCNLRRALLPPRGFPHSREGLPTNCPELSELFSTPSSSWCRVPGAGQTSQEGGRRDCRTSSFQALSRPAARSQWDGGGRILALWPGAHSRTHLGRRLPEQRSVIQAAGPIGPGSKVLHFGVASLVPSRSKASPHQLAKSGRPPLTAHAWPGPWGQWGVREIPKGRLSLPGVPGPLRPSPAVRLSSGCRGK